MSICDGRRPKEERRDKNEDEKKEGKKEETPGEEKSVVATSARRTTMLMRTARLKANVPLPPVAPMDSQEPPAKEHIETPLRIVKTSCKVLFDNCSQWTHVTKRFANAIGAPFHHRAKKNISGFGGLSTGAKMYDVVQFVISKENCPLSLTIQATVVEKICSPIRGMYVPDLIDAYPHLRDLKLADDDLQGEEQEIDILIGLDYYYDIITGGVIRGSEGPKAIASIFGYMLAGKAVDTHKDSTTSDVSMVLSTTVTNEEIHDELKRFWEVEAIGIAAEEENEKSTFELNPEYRDGRYYVNAPEKKIHPPLCDNYKNAHRRWQGTKRRLEKDEELSDGYWEIMQYQEGAGIIEDAPADSEVFRTYYMPNHLVIRRDKEKSRIRVVYDCSSKEGDAVALNECMEPGECDFLDLLMNFIRFRCYAIGISADIEKAFLMVGLKEEDRDLFRFLIKKNQGETEDEEPRHMRFTRVTFACVSSMAILDKVIRHHLAKVANKYPRTIPIITNSLYVDDLSGGENSEDDGFRLYKETKEVFNEAGMNMRKWVTSSKSLSEKINECESEVSSGSEDSETYVSEQLNREEKAATKVLGVPWDTENDELLFTLDVLKNYPVGRITKVILLGATAKIFDPPGMLAPLVFTLKTLFQAVCKGKCEWQETLSPETQEVWDKFLKEAKQFSGLRIPRCYGQVFTGMVTLVGFGDASLKGYAACVYVVSRQEDGSATSALVACKTRVAPLKKTTMPRMELLAASILAQLVWKVKGGLEKLIEIRNVVCLTDAEIVLN